MSDVRKCQTFQPKCSSQNTHIQQLARRFQVSSPDIKTTVLTKKREAYQQMKLFSILELRDNHETLLLANTIRALLASVLR